MKEKLPDNSRSVRAGVHIGVWAALMALTGLTIFVAGMDLGFLNIVAALAIATAKATLVILFFMDLRHESPVFRNMLVAALVVLAIFLGLTFFDVGYRY